MKKILSVLLCVIFLVTMVGCGASEEAIEEYRNKTYIFLMAHANAGKDYYGLDDFIEMLDIAANNGEGYKTFYPSDDKWEEYKGICQDVLNSMDEMYKPLKNPPSECQREYDLAGKIDAAARRLITIRIAAGETEDQSSSMTLTYKSLAEDAKMEYIDAVIELSDYFKSIDYVYSLETNT